MATLEAIRGGGGSVRVGTVGKISSLMMRELETSSSVPLRQTRVPGSCDSCEPRRSTDEASSSGICSDSKHRNTEVVRITGGANPHRVPVLSPATPPRQKQKTTLEDVGNSTIRQTVSKRSPDRSVKTRSHKLSYQIPMLGAENIHLEKTPIRDKTMRRGTKIVDIVDINCGNPRSSLSSRLKKLGFSKLSRSFI